MEDLSSPPLWGRLLPLSTNNRIGWKDFPGNLVYFNYGRKKFYNIGHSYRDSQRYSDFLEEELALEKSLKSPDYYDYEAKYTQMSTDPSSYSKLMEPTGLKVIKPFYFL